MIDPIHRYQLRSRDLKAYVAEGNLGADKRRAQHLQSLDALRKRCEEHLSALKVLCPNIPETTIVRAQDPTRQPLYLPSGFDPDVQREYNLTRLVGQEAELRIGSAHDQLNALKDALGLRRLLAQAKKQHARGLGQATRYQTSLNRASDVIARHQEGYKRNWIAIRKLGVKIEEDPRVNGLQDLKEADVRDLRDFIDSDRFSGRSGDLPWIWRSFSNDQYPGSSVAEVKQAIVNWEQEGKSGLCYLKVYYPLTFSHEQQVLRLTWVHMRSARDRWWEEQALLFEELRRIVATFEHMGTYWDSKQPSSSLPSLVQKGFRSYALKKANLFFSLAEKARIQFAAIKDHQEREAEGLIRMNEPMTGIERRDEDFVPVSIGIELEEIL